jgi:hypothetical protein
LNRKDCKDEHDVAIEKTASRTERLVRHSTRPILWVSKKKDHNYPSILDESTTTNENEDKRIEIILPVLPSNPHNHSITKH